MTFLFLLSSADAVLLLTQPTGRGWGCTRVGTWGAVSQGCPSPRGLRGTEQGREDKGCWQWGVWLPRSPPPALWGQASTNDSFSTLCVLLEWVLLLSGAPDADRQWFHKKEAESFLSSYWREPGGCLRQRRQHWQWARSRVGMGFHIHHHNESSCRWWSWIPVSVFFIGLLYLNWILTLFVKKCSWTMTLFRFFCMGNSAKLYVIEWLGLFFQISWKEKFCSHLNDCFPNGVN